MNSLLQRAKNAPISKSKKEYSPSSSEKELALAWVNRTVTTHQVMVAIENTNVYGFLANTLAAIIREQHVGHKSVIGIPQNVTPTYQNGVASTNFRR